MTGLPPAGDCEPDWTPTTPAEHLRHPNWRDDPDALAALCDQGCRDLYGEFATPRDTDTITLIGEYLMTPAAELRAAINRLNDTRNCDNHTLDCDSRELLDLIRVLLRAREPIAAWLTAIADFCDSVEDVHGSQPPADNLSITDALTVARAVNAAARPGPVLGGQITDHLAGGRP